MIKALLGRNKQTPTETTIRTTGTNMAGTTANNYSKPNFEARVGLFVLFAFIILVWSWGWLKSISLIHPPQRFIVKFHDVAGLNNNATVNVNGVRVGIVEKIELKKKGEVLVNLKINTEDAVIKKGSTFSIQTLGLVGAKYVEITLPDLKEDDPGVNLDAGEVQIGQDPVRTEIYLNRIAMQLGNLDLDGIQLKLKKDLDSIDLAANNASATLKSYGESAPRFNEIAKNMDKVASRADTAVASANTFFNKASNMTDDFRGTAKRANKILDNPVLSQDLKETATQARQAADKIQSAIAELNKTVGDKDARADLLAMMTKLQASTENISASIKKVDRIADDKGLRTDLKDIVDKANTALDKVDKVVSGPEFGVDVKKTMVDVQNAANHLDQAAQAINERVSGKHWLLKGITGGSIKEVKKTVQTDAKGTKKETTQVKIDTSKSPDAIDPSSAPKDSAEAAKEQM
jgi:ABC-type transporter Mla subunit MlaD